MCARNNGMVYKPLNDMDGGDDGADGADSWILGDHGCRISWIWWSTSGKE